MTELFVVELHPGEVASLVRMPQLATSREETKAFWNNVTEAAGKLDVCDSVVVGGDLNGLTGARNEALGAHGCALKHEGLAKTSLWHRNSQWSTHPSLRGYSTLLAMQVEGTTQKDLKVINKCKITVH